MDHLAIIIGAYALFVIFEGASASEAARPASSQTWLSLAWFAFSVAIMYASTITIIAQMLTLFGVIGA